MGENIKELLNEEIAAEIQAISSLDSGSEKKSKAIEDLAKLYRLRIEESKNELDAEDKRSRRTWSKTKRKENVMQKVKISKRVGRQLYRSSPTILTVVAFFKSLSYKSASLIQNTFSCTCIFSFAGMSSTRIIPSSAKIRFAIILISVDLPAPFRPKRP